MTRDSSEVSSRRARYIVGRNTGSLPGGVEPLDPEMLTNLFRDTGRLEELGIEKIDEIGSTDEPLMVFLADGWTLKALKAQFDEALIVEEDRPLDLISTPQDLGETGAQRKRYFVYESTESSPRGPRSVEPGTLERALDLDFFSVLEEPSSSDIQKKYVVAMDDEGMKELRERFGPSVIVENYDPFVSQTEVPEPGLEMPYDPGLVPLGEALRVCITVREEASQHHPVPDAEVYLIGQHFPALGKTDENGQAILTMFGETTETLQTLIVRPGQNYWSRVISRPDVKPDQDNVVSVKNLSVQMADFPEEETYTWGELAMHLDRIPETYRGQGVRIAIIDSGIQTGHDDLKAEDGWDFRDGSEDPKSSWTQDSIGHGSHCTGIIAGLVNGRGIRGFAPDARIYGFSIFPGGLTSQLINALQRCIDDKIDVVNLSLGDSQESRLLHQKIQEAKESGVACVVAAGDSAGPVMYPAAFEEVLAVAAVGQRGTFPEDSDHQRRIGPYESADGNYFTASFTCFGEQVDICAPGVAVVSAVPENGWAAWDGTSMACPHVTGLAALVLAHGNDPMLQPRSSGRVEKLFEILKESTVKLSLPPEYQGSGLPNAQKALEVIDEPWQTPQDDFLDKLINLLGQALEVVKDHKGHASHGSSSHPTHLEANGPETVDRLLAVDGLALERGRKSKHLTVKALADQAGVSAATIRSMESSRMETDPHPAKQSTLEKVAEVLEIESTMLGKEE